MNKVPLTEQPLRFIDLFCGIGGFHVAASSLGMQCVFACDIDEGARKAYSRNYGLMPAGDIVSTNAQDIPDHDMLFAGFPCQSFSIIGQRGGFLDSRGALFFEALRIIRAKLPAAIVLENVKQLISAQNGVVIKRIVDDLESLGYDVDYRILNALDFGLPQKRERTIIVAMLNSLSGFEWPKKAVPLKPLSAILEENPDQKHFVSDRILRKRRKAHTAIAKPGIWHENKAGNISSHEWSCALRANASYNYLLVDGERRLTPREMLRLQGFPDRFKIICNDAQTRKQVGNSVPVPMVKNVIKEVCNVLKKTEVARSF